MMKGHLKTFLVFALLIFSTVWTNAHAQTSISREKAEEIISEAEEALIAAYQAIAGAEDAKANVSELVAALNSAISLTDQARLHYSAGRYTEAYQLAGQAISICDQIVVDSKELREKALRESPSITFLIATGTITSLIIAISIYILSKWWRLRRTKRMLKMRIRVVKGEGD